MRFRDILRRVQKTLKRLDAPEVLCADDDDSVRALCVTALRRSGYAVDEAADGRDAWEKLQSKPYAAVLLDLGMPYLHGATLVSLLSREKPEMMKRVVVVTGMSDAALVDVQPLVASVLRKPLTLEGIVGAVSDCCVNDDTIVGSSNVSSKTAAR